MANEQEVSMKRWLVLLASLLAFQTIVQAQDATKARSIKDAKQEANGTFVTVTGRVTATSLAAVYIQDATGGIGVFDRMFKKGVAVGDSVLISGELTEFGNIEGTPNTGLKQIAGAQGFQWKKISTPEQPLLASTITAEEIGEQTDCMLVTIPRCVFEQQGEFTGGKNYKVVAAGTEFYVRIDKFTDIVDSAIPAVPVTLVGIVSRYKGKYQFLLRDRNDIVIETSK